MCVMRARSAAWLGVAVLLAAALAGCLGQGPSGGSRAATPEAAPDQEPGNVSPTANATRRDYRTRGNLSFNSTDTAWIDVAAVVTNQTPPDAVLFDVRFLWTEPDVGDETQRMACAQVTERFNGSAFSPWKTAWAGVCKPYTFDRPWGYGDGAVEAGVEAAGREVEADVPAPHASWVRSQACVGYSDPCGTDRIRFTRPFGANYSWYVNEGQEREVVHWRFFTGAHPPDRTVVRLQWHNTTVNVSRGGGEDMFWYFREDFDHETFVKADVLPWWGPAYEEAAVLETSLVNDTDERAFFWYQFDEWGTWQDEPVGSYRRPNGSTWQDDDFALESTNQTGTWRFAYPSHRRREADKPVIWGFRGGWTEMPWGVS